MLQVLRYSFCVSLFLSFFLGQSLQAAVIYEQSQTGTLYDLHNDEGAGYGFYSKLPQYQGTGTLFQGGGDAYTGTAYWLRVKRLSGVSCEIPRNIGLYTTDGLIEIGKVGVGSTTGPYCDFPITGANRTDMKLGYIALCVDASCTARAGTLVLDGSPTNSGYVFDGSQTKKQTGGWAFQLCDEEGCSGGFEAPASTSTPTTTATTTPPKGASSILFLPGIMGSHLYEDDGECFGFGEQRRWFSHTDCEQLRLLTNPDGSSINDIYTKFEDESIADKASVAVFTEELYTNFLANMNQLENEKIVKEFTPFPYDWRLRLDHILRSTHSSSTKEVRYDPVASLQDGLLYKTLSQMASSSYNGKVTIVSHSNGGLVAKALLAELSSKNDPLKDKIDNLILIGSPQIGTPDAINGLLHGTEIGPGGVVINQVTTRQILNTAPFGHHLLPNEQYFNSAGVSVETPVINFKEGLATNLWRIQYGESINSFEELKRFLDDSSGRVKPASTDLETPDVVEGTLLIYAEEIGDVLANWEVPETLTVHQLGGSGIWTPSRVEYSSNDYCVRADQFGFSCPVYQQRLYTELHGTFDGDGTVVLPSALAMAESDKKERLWLNLFKYNDEKDKDESLKVHKNMLEVPEVAMFVRNIAIGATSSYKYIIDTPPPVPEEVRLMFHLHSPLDMYVTSDQGVVSSTTNEVTGAFYRRFGDVQYISLPNTVSNAALHLVGYDTGSFSLFRELWEGETEVSSVDFKALPTNVGTVVTLPINFDEAGVMQVDFDGDGMIDGTVTESEDVIKAVMETPTPAEPEVAEEKSGNSGTRVVRDPKGVVAGTSTDSTEEQLREIIRLLQLIINLLREETL